MRLSRPAHDISRKVCSCSRPRTFRRETGRDWLPLEPGHRARKARNCFWTRSTCQILNRYVFEGDCQMRTMMRSLVVCFLMIIVILLSIPQSHAQDLSRYRNFSFGMTVADLSKQIDRTPANAAVLHERPALIQELTWLSIQPYD